MDWHSRATHPLEVDIRLLDLQPARTHDLPLEDEQLERRGIRAEDLENVLTDCVHRNNRFCYGVNTSIQHRNFATELTSEGIYRL